MRCLLMPLSVCVLVVGCNRREQTNPPHASAPEPIEETQPPLPAPTAVEQIEGMSASRAKEVIARVGKDVEDAGNVVRFSAGEVPMAMIVDVRADRMRIVAPIAESKDYGVDELTVLMQANYHSALDARYALSEGVVYAAFIHPLSALSEAELESGVVQVANLVLTFGTAFSSTGSYFGAPAQPPSST